jgi:hypothetical protein
MKADGEPTSQEPLRMPPHFREHDCCGDCIASSVQEDRKLFCFRFGLFVEAECLCNGYEE